MADLERCRKELLTTLREKASKYWELMKSWYKRRISKDEFDAKAKSLLGEEGIQIHNEFLFAILMKCQGVVKEESPQVSDYSKKIDLHEKHSVVKHDTQVQDFTPYGTFSSVDVYDIEIGSSNICFKDLDRLLLCCHELLLPDYPTLHVRMLLGVWEYNLEDVSEEAVRYLMLAVEYFLKSCISFCATSSTQHIANGLSLGDSKIHSKSLLVEASEAQYTSQTHHTIISQPMTLFQLRDSLQSGGVIHISDHFVRQSFMERILFRMWHPNKEEIKSKRSLQKWQRNYNYQ